MGTPTVHLLPPNLGRLAAHTDDGTARFALNTVHVEFDRSRFTAAATDTKVLVVVEGACDEDREKEFPEIPALLAAPNGATKALVPAAAWDKAFRTASKIRHVRKVTPMRNLACVVGDVVTSFAATNGEVTDFAQTANAVGKFPPFRDIFEKTEKRTAGGADVDKIAELMADANDAETFDEVQRAKKREEAKEVAATTCTKRFAMDPLMLAELLKTLHAIACGPDNCRVEFEVGHPQGPIIIRAGTDELHVKALQMPLVG